MKLIRYLETVKLLKAENKKQSNGVYMKSYNEIDKYSIQRKTLNDEVSATVYGAKITKMLNISTPLHSLEKLLMTKVDNKEDNISLYFVELDNAKFKITSVTKNSITLERL